MGGAKGTRIVVPAIALLFAGCGVVTEEESKRSGSGAAAGGADGGTAVEKQAAKTTSDWLKAAIDVDGKRYCRQMTIDLHEQTTGAQSDQARAKCERSASSPIAGELPLRIAVVAEDATNHTARVKLVSEVPTSVRLVKERGTFRVESVRGDRGRGEDPGGRPGATPQEQQAERVMKTLLKAAVDEDGRTYCAQLTVRLLERLTGERSDRAKAKCRRLAEADERPTRIPVDLDVVAKSSEEQSAEASIRRRLPRSLILRTEGGRYRLDSVK